METKWLKDALFAGMTANAFKLGTVLSLGWFWQRIGGCQTLYRGDTMETINFANILAVANLDANEIYVPNYVEHNSNSIYFYAIRRANRCGRQEHSLSAAVKVSIDADGNLSQSQPNSIFEVKAKQIDGDKIELLWYYCPLEQKSSPVRFNIYYDNGSGQIDYESPVAVIEYAGRLFYRYQSEPLNEGTYLFAVRAEDAAGIENHCLAQLKIQLDMTDPDAIDTLKAEAV
ncbi:MAG: hypothetical protein DRP62_04480 [Planctomycetota bacterium]|nr:MAG: hypothetical protein DRP62_04480 [Planctomycetota bacterium]